MGKKPKNDFFGKKEKKYPKIFTKHTISDVFLLTEFDDVKKIYRIPLSLSQNAHLEPKIAKNSRK